MKLRDWLAHPLTVGLDIDDPATTAIRRQIIAENHFLRRIYEDWYRLIAEAVPAMPGAALELGSGAGFLKHYLPDALASELFICPDIHLVLDAHALPFRSATLRAIVMTNVLHHLARPRTFLGEAARCVRSGGVLAIVEPWVTPWSRLIYNHLHHEPFVPDALSWEFPAAGPLSGANGALPWILFERDRSIFAREFPQWTIQTVRPFMPFRYLVSGGVSMRPLMPEWAYPLWSALESTLERFGMFAFIVLKRN
jgi:SAM-dependent methyltransferase